MVYLMEKVPINVVPSAKGDLVWYGDHFPASIPQEPLKVCAFFDLATTWRPLGDFFITPFYVNGSDRKVVVTPQLCRHDVLTSAYYLFHLF